ncbi:hypothetical protein CHS0354_019402 [Potamilus streckersoni]|uniref:Uncharacterized protein n=1 Tax=Potamilus streckersoni TaxID=2493646 RepID=A0AAE0SI43_9BIVA|nr:hypothetical protein CHS0354_019402 [Potamilus streckersoni]
MVAANGGHSLAKYFSLAGALQEEAVSKVGFYRRLHNAVGRSILDTVRFEDGIRLGSHADELGIKFVTSVRSLQ